MPGKPCFTHADRIVLVLGAGTDSDRGDLAERVMQQGGLVVSDDEAASATHCVVAPEVWLQHSQGLSSHPALQSVLSTNAGRATDFSAPAIHVLPVLWLTASLNLRLKVPERSHSLLISHPSPAPQRGGFPLKPPTQPSLSLFEAAQQHCVH